MSKPRHLISAPITEAIFDIRVRARSNLQISEFSQLRQELRERFPKFDEKKVRTVTFLISPSHVKEPTIEDQGSHGFFFTSDDKTLIAQFRIDGFTLNKLKPYTSWNELFPIAKELWKKYYSTALPIAATRLALRYINKIPIGQNDINLDEYLRGAPQIPDELPQTLSAFFSRVTIFDPDKNLRANVVQTFQPNPDKGGITILLDIDAFREVDVAPDDPIIEKYFSELREFKNLIFFNYLTERALGLFE